MKKIAALLLAGGLLVGVAAAAHAGKPVKVFEDASGDAGIQDNAAPGFAEAGLDLVAGSIAKAGPNLDFSVEHAAMPSSGTLPEGFRLLWHFNVDGTEYRFTVKTADIGKPDVAAGGSGQERIGQVDTDGHFRLEECVDEPLPAVLTLINCYTVEYLEGEIDAAAKTISWSVPLKTLKAKTGSLIAGGTAGAAASGCQICWVPHYAERSLTPYTIIDAATQTAPYKIPKK